MAFAGKRICSFHPGAESVRSLALQGSRSFALGLFESAGARLITSRPPALRTAHFPPATGDASLGGRARF
jgi:hypothetical protein